MPEVLPGSLEKQLPFQDGQGLGSVEQDLCADLTPILVLSHKPWGGSDVMRGLNFRL